MRAPPLRRSCWQLLALALAGTPLFGGCSLDVLQSGLGAGGAGGDVGQGGGSQGGNRCTAAIAVMEPVVGQTVVDGWVAINADSKVASVFKAQNGGAFSGLCARLRGRAAGSQEVRGVFYDDLDSMLRGQTDVVAVAGDAPAGWVELLVQSPIAVQPTEQLTIGLHAGSNDALELGNSANGDHLLGHDTFANGPSATFDAEGTPMTLNGTLAVFALYQ